jgi:diguanylate cyclase (GGDEF)-like protein
LWMPQRMRKTYCPYGASCTARLQPALLLETDQTSALNVGERLRSALDRPKYAGASTIGIGQIAAYSVSVGVATLCDGETFTELIRRADAALYKAKSSGRNTVVCASSLP